MALNFPSSPTDGQIYYDPTSGNRYRYVAATSKWIYDTSSSPAATFSSNTYGGSTQIPVITFNSYGLIDSMANVSVQGMDYNYANLIGAASNTWANNVGTAGNSYSIQVGTASNNWSNTKVSSVIGTSGQIYSSDGVTVTLNLVSTNVTAGVYGGSTQIPYFIVDDYGRITGAANVAVQGMDYEYANNIGAASNSWANTVGIASNNYSIQVGAASNSWANTVGIASNNYVDTTFLPLTGGTITGNISANNITVSYDAYIGRNMSIQGNLSVYGTTTSVTAANFKIADNLLYLNEPQQATITNAYGDGANVTFDADNSFFAGGVVLVEGMNPSQYNTGGFTYVPVVTANSTSFVIANTTTSTFVSGGTAYFKAAVNPDLGFSGGYNDGSYHHAGFFRDSSDGVFKVFDGYNPEPDANVNIDTNDASFTLAPLLAGRVTANSVVAGTINVEPTLVSSFDKANSAYLHGTDAFDKANSAYLHGTDAFDKANSVLVHATLAFDKANSANVLAYDTGIGANAYSDTKTANVFGTSGRTTVAYTTTGGFNNATVDLATTSVSASTYGGATNIPVFTVDSYGRLTYASNVAISGGSMDYVYANSIGAASNTWANTKLSNTSGISFAGDLYFPTGNVSIGSTSTNGLLTLRGYTGGTAGSAVANSVKTFVIGGAYNQVFNSANSVLMWIGDYSNDTSDNIYPIYCEDENNLIDFYLYSGTNGNYDTKRAFIGGNLGVGTQSPSQKLHVVGTGFASSDFRAPIFYDSDNTSYYVNPASSSVINNISGNFTIFGGSSASPGLGWENQTSFIRTAFYDWDFYDWDVGSIFRLNSYASSSTSFRAPIFYDSTDTAYYFGSGSGSSNFSSVYANDWFRAYGATGLYAQSYGNHWYSTDSGYWSHGGNGSRSYGGIRLLQGHESVVRGYLYWDGTDNFGLLHKDGGWVIRTWTTGSELYGSTRSPIFYDSNDTAYYCDPNSSSKFSSLTTTGRIYSNEWIQMDNASGLYSPTNGAHFYPNDANYGSWRVRGSRNGWLGLEFSDCTNGNISLMVGGDSNYTGFHNNSYGWKFTIISGIMYVWDGTYGGGTQRRILDTDRWQDSKYFASNGDIYGVRFYDANDSSRYCDPFSWSELNGLSTNSHYIRGGYMLYSDHGSWTGEYNKIQWHSTHLYLQNNGGGYLIILRRGDGGERFWCDYNGNVTCSGSMTVNSDRRLKENIKTINNALDLVKRLRGVTFDWIDSKKPAYGFIAQEVEEVIPEMVLEYENGTADGDEKRILKSVDYDKMTAVLIEAMKEQQNQIDALREEINMLKGKC